MILCGSVSVKESSGVKSVCGCVF